MTGEQRSLAEKEYALSTKTKRMQGDYNPAWANKFDRTEEKVFKTFLIRERESPENDYFPTMLDYRQVPPLLRACVGSDVGRGRRNIGNSRRQRHTATRSLSFSSLSRGSVGHAATGVLRAPGRQHPAGGGGGPAPAGRPQRGRAAAGDPPSRPHHPGRAHHPHRRRDHRRTPAPPSCASAAWAWAGRADVSH
jgi:hypothetical protein